MSNLKISEMLSADSPLSGLEIIPVVQNGNNVSVSVNEIRGVGGESSTSVQAALDLKADIAGPTFTGNPQSNAAPVSGDHLTNKTYVDAKEILIPQYVAISSNSTLNVDKTNTSDATHTYPIADFVGTSYDSTKVIGFYIKCTASARRIGGSSSTANIKATFPDGTDHSIFMYEAQTPEDDTSKIRSTVFVPVALGQTNLVIKPTLSGETKSTRFIIIGCSQLVAM